MTAPFLTEDHFYSQASKMRNFFVSQFSDPKKTESKRFVWDYWHVPDQYTLMRTPAYHYFPQKMYMDFHKSLVMWGRHNLGCWDISPPWLSYYINGCKQELHSDVPHGPWAFVYSLTPWKNRRFSGGETLILKPDVLSYWRNFGSNQDRELASFIDRVPALMNRLTVFDPRYPHGVTEVRGTQDPLEGRLVIHGWFTEPKTYVEGPLPSKSTEKKLNEAFDRLQEVLAHEELCQGTLSLQMRVRASGSVSKIQFATNTLLNLDGRVPKSLNQKILRLYGDLKFSSARSTSHMTIPLIFR